MRLWYRDKVLQVLLAMLVGTFTFSFTLLAGVEENSVPHVGVTVTGVLMTADLFLFLFFLDRFVHRLRPVAVAASPPTAGRRAFDVRRPRGEQARRARDRPRAAGDPGRADDGRALAQRRLDPGDRRLADLSASRASTAARSSSTTSSGTSFRPERRVIRVYGGEPERRAATSSAFAE